MLDLTTAGVLVACLACALGALAARARGSRAHKDLPPMAPLSMLEVIANMSSLSQTMWALELSRRFGAVFRLRMPVWADFVFCGDGDLARRILLDPTTRKPEFLYKMAEGLTGDFPNIFAYRDNSTHSAWARARKGAVPAFQPKNLQGLRDVCCARMERWVRDVLEPAVGRAEGVEIPYHMLRVVIGAICEAGFGYDPSAAECDAALGAIDELSKEFFLRRTANPLRGAYAWATLSGRSAARARGSLLDFTGRMLARYRALPDAERAARAHTLIGLVDANAGYPTDDHRLADLMIYLIAGHDTTAYQLSWVLHALAKHPEAQVELRAALREAKEAGVDPSVKCRELHAVVRETMRLNCVASGGSMRQPMRDFATADGRTVPAGSIVWVNFMACFRNKDAFEQPDEWRPERWLRADGGAQTGAAADGAAPDIAPDPTAIFPFSLGRRNCIGQALAMSELLGTLPLLIGRYRWEVETEPEPQHFLTFKPIGLRLRATRVSDSRQG